MGDEEKNVVALGDNELDDVAGGIEKDYIGGASKRNRCVAYGGHWKQYCNRPNWVDVGKSYISTFDDRRKYMICLNCGAQAQFKLYNNGQWGLTPDGSTDD